MAPPDLTQGPLLPRILRLAGPAALMMLLQGFYNFVDTYFVGRMGANALAGISTAGFVLWMTFAFAQLMSVGIAAKVARRIGEKNRAEADRTALRGMVYTTAWALVMAAVLSEALPWLFDLMDTPAAVTEMGIRYLTPLILGLPLIFLSFMINAIFTSAGDTRSPFIIMLLSLLLNAVLDPLLIFGLGGFPELGIAGAAWATIVSRLLWLVLALRQLRHPKTGIALRRHGALAMSWRDVGQIMRIGAPKAITGVLFSGIYMALTRITSEFGTPNIAALRIGHIYEGMTFLSAVGFSMAAGTLVGQNLGAKQPARARHAAYTTAGIVAAYSSLIGLGFFVFSEALAGVFSPEASIVNAAAVYLAILAISQPFMAVEIVLEGSFSGAGNTLPPMAVQFPLTLLRYPVAYFLAFHTDLGVAGVWWAISGSSVLKCGLLAWWFRKGHWAHTEV